MSERPQATPQRFDEYRVLRKLGAGASGDVYLAEDTLLDREVAIKILRVADDGGQLVVEARALARLSHPNVVAVYRVGHWQRRPYLVSEFMRGRSLDKTPRPLPPERVIAVALGLARGLAAAHRRGVLHRDLKPANVMVADDGEVKLVDFGVAHRTDREPGSGGPVGTPLYMAPELWRGEAATARSDLYSLGVLIYELAVGRAPLADVDLEELAAASQRPAAPLPSAGPLGAIVARCLEVDPVRRWPSADALAQALAELAQPPRAPSLPAGNPYRGLLAFDDDHRDLFFGRERDVATIVDRLRADPFVVVAGDSGAGKSSLCRAGVLPLVAAGALGAGRCVTARLRPGRRPLAALAAALAPACGVDESELVAAMREDACALPRALRKHGGPTTRVLVFVDQLEELITAADAEEAAAADAVLAALADGGAGVRLLATARSDFLARLSGRPAFGPLLARATHLLWPLDEEGLRRAVVGPARAMGFAFEDDATVDELVATTVVANGALPLLQFALRALWEARDVERRLIPSRALGDIGGVSGALSRHADRVLGALPPPVRAAARRLLLALVSADATRVARDEAELGADADARAALEALVHGRLVVARDGEGEAGSYELAHEALIDGWPTLRGWLHRDEERRQAHARLSRAAAEWKRLGGARETLWSGRRLAEAQLLASETLAPAEAAFVAASRAMQRRALWRRAAVAALFPLVAGVIYGGVRAKERRDLGRAVAGELAAARDAVAAAERDERDGDLARAEAFARFDARVATDGEAAWSRALAADAAAERAHASADQALEKALLLDGSRADVRTAYADLLYSRALLAERTRAPQRDERLERLALFDNDGSRRRRWAAPGTLAVTTTPAGAAARLVSGDGRELALGATPVGARPVPRGSYLLVLERAGEPPVRAPIVIGRGEALAVDIALPSQLPDGFVYVPPGRFLFGSDDEALRKNFLGTAPLHAVTTGAYLIARHEVTFADWIAFLRALPPADRAAHTPSTGSASFNGAVALVARSDGRYQLRLAPGGQLHLAVEGEPIVYRRARRAVQDWRRMPVVGISARDAEAYAAWLDRSGRLPGARLCTETEWERGARGADGRAYPHGDVITPDDADFDETYGRQPGALGPDEVGAHPTSTSPFGLADMAGNAAEWVVSSLAPNEYLVRGGSFYFDRKLAQSTNRQVADPSFRDIAGGARLCVDAETWARRATANLAMRRQ